MYVYKRLKKKKKKKKNICYFLLGFLAHQGVCSLRKQAYSNILKFLQSKNENFQRRMLIFFLISAQNILCGYSLEPPRWGGSNEYLQFMLLSRNKKNNVYPCKPPFYYIKVGFKGSTLYKRVFVMSQDSFLLRIDFLTEWRQKHFCQLLTCTVFLKKLTKILCKIRYLYKPAHKSLCLLC